MDILKKIFNKNSDAIIFEDRTLSYLELKKYILSASKYLLNNNVNKNDRVIIQGKNSIEFIISIFALWNIGAVPVPLNYNLTENELINLIDVLSSKVILTDKSSNYPDNIIHINFPFPYEENSGKAELFLNVDLGQTAVILFTSGTSGITKAVNLSFNNLIKSGQNQNKFLKLEENEKYLASLPFYHIGGLSIISRTFLSGGKIIIPKSLKNDDLIEAINKYQPVSISLVPTQLKRLLHHNFTPQDNLRNVLIGGSSIDKVLLEEAFEKGYKIVIVYGSTETCSFIAAKRITNKSEISNSFNKTISGNQIKIINGKIAVKGDSVMQSYINAKAHFTEDGFFITEDVGYLDENNELIIVGRNDEIIISGGENISLVEIENNVKEFNKIKEAVAFGMKDDEWGEIVAVTVVTYGNEIFPLDQLNKYLSKKLANFKLPKKIFFVDEIPRNEMGKVLKKELLEMIN